MSDSFAGLRVLLVARFNRRYHHTGFGIAAGLESLGAEVSRLDLRPRGLDALLGRSLAARLRAACRRRFDLVLTYKAGELEPAIIAAARAPGGPRWINWFPDSPHLLDLSLRNGAAYDRVFLFDSYMVERHRSLGRDAEFLPLGVDPAVWRPIPGAGAPIPIVFVGTTEPLRDLALARLADLGLRAWGPGRPAGALFGAPLVRTLSRALVGLNIHQFFGEPPEAGRYGTGANQRVFELAAVGCCQLVDAKADLTRSYAEDREVVLFRSVDELAEKAAALLARPEEARAIGARARERTLREHTWRHRLAELVTRSLR